MPPIVPENCDIHFPQQFFAKLFHTSEPIVSTQINKEYSNKNETLNPIKESKRERFEHAKSYLVLNTITHLPYHFSCETYLKML